MIGGRDNRRDAAAVHPGNAAEFEGGGGENAAGVAERDDGVGLAVVDQFHRADNRAVLFAADGGGGLVLHGQHFAGVDDPDAVVAEAAAGQGGVDFGFVADEEQGGNALVGLDGPQGAFNDHPAAVVAAHDIHCNSHNQDRPRAKRGRATQGFRLQP